MELFGLRIKEIRLYKKLSQEEVAFRAGLHPAQIGHIERSEKSPTVNTIFKLAKGLNVDVSTLFTFNSIYEEELTDREIMEQLTRSLSALDHDEQLEVLQFIKSIADWKRKLLAKKHFD